MGADELGTAKRIVSGHWIAAASAYAQKGELGRGLISHGLEKMDNGI